MDESKWSLADRWIVSRFNRTVTEADEALAHYRFDQYAKICYDFFYGDFCDWYVEASKPALRDPNTTPNRKYPRRRLGWLPAINASHDPLHHRIHLATTL